MRREEENVKNLLERAYKNPILEYWESIKYKPLLFKIELLQREIQKAKKNNIESGGGISQKREELEGLLAEKKELCKSGIVVNTSWKVYYMYRDIVDNILDNPQSKWKYSALKANHAIFFIERYCRHSKGDYGGEPFILEVWQKALVAATFGIVSRETGFRKYREVLLVVGRKNGKSTLAAAIGLYLQLGDNESGAEVYALATKKDQAKVIWLEAKKMVKKSPELLKLDKPLVAELTAEFNDSTFKPLGRDSDTLDGLNVHGATMDEIHAWKDDNLYDVIVDGTSARSQPLIFIVTTAGTEREHIYDKKYAEAENLINFLNDKEGYEDETLLALIYELDNRDEWIEPDCWGKANPGLGTIKKTDNLQKKVEKAKVNSGDIKNLLCKDFDIPETTKEAWLTKQDADNDATFEIIKLKPRYGIGGVDLSGSVDLTAAKVLFMVPEDPIIYQISMYWVPEDLVEQRIREDKIPYDVWIEKGYVRTCPGNSNHPKYVTKWLCEVRDQCDIYLPWIGYDAWAAKYWVEEMKAEFGENSMIAVRQGKQTLSSPMKSLKAVLQRNGLNYNNNPVDKWCLYNTAVDVDKNDNIQPVKTSNPRRRIDGTAATLDAYVVMEEKMNDYLSLI